MRVLRLLEGAVIISLLAQSLHKILFIKRGGKFLAALFLIRNAMVMLATVSYSPRGILVMGLDKKIHGPLVAAALLVPFFGFQFASAGSPETDLHPSKIDEKSLQANTYPADGVVLGNHEGCGRLTGEQIAKQECVQ